MDNSPIQERRDSIAAIREGWADVAAGRTRSAREVLEEIARKYHLPPASMLFQAVLRCPKCQRDFVVGIKLGRIPIATDRFVVYCPLNGSRLEFVAVDPERELSPYLTLATDLIQVEEFWGNIAVANPVTQ